MLSKEQKSQIKMSMNDKWHLVKLTHVWPDGHLINQMAHALIERNAELLSLREQLAELKALEPVGYVGNSDLYALSTGTLGCIAPYNAFEGIPLFTAAKPAED
ncbi:TPA: hypothetical protein PXM90_000639 [Yersinia enterocolitica]|nr:hypothetical protein [Yersinia enterocolitica]HDL6991095.1 hypothetical protein [Yersinia enterocolitica]HDL6998925.1 hypothetical protein [Yersinia enterocolitica]HDL7106764.1 hypothetical protein [Yersinia enterocolitica]HDL7115235.1 hypothetical protein [Yersinia enterocolitica]